MTIAEFISKNSGYISSSEAKGASLYDYLLNSVRGGDVVRVHRGWYAENGCLDKKMFPHRFSVPFFAVS